MEKEARHLFFVKAWVQRHVPGRTITRNIHCQPPRNLSFERKRFGCLTVLWLTAENAKDWECDGKMYVFVLDSAFVANNAF